MHFRIKTLLPLFVAVCLPLHADTGTIKVAAILCLTGACAQTGQGSLHGARFAVDELNAAGGVLGKKLELVVEDNREAVSGANTVGAFQKLRLDADIRLFLGPTWTPGGLAVAPLVAKHKEIIMISPSLGAREFSKTAGNIFNSWGTSEPATRKTARYAFEKGHRRIAIFSSEQPWDAEQGRHFKDEFEKLGGTISAYVEPDPSRTDIKSEALKVTSSKPDAVFFSTYGQLPTATREVRALNPKLPKFAALVEDVTIAAASGALEDTVSFGLGHPDANFTRRVEERFGDTTEIYAALAYDTVKLYVDTVKQLGTIDGLAVSKALASVKYVGTAGTLSFDSDRCAVREFKGWTVRGGKLVELSS